MKPLLKAVLLLPLWAPACSAPRPAALPVVPRQAITPVADSEPVRLYARDGTVVHPGRQPTEGDPSSLHEPEGVGGSRYRMLELYQQVVDERDALAIEVDRLNADLDKSMAEAKDLRERLAAAQANLEDARSELARLREQNRELAGRLTTAQIRRLEAEKLLLEARIEWTRLQAIGATDVPPPPLPEPQGLPQEPTTLDQSPTGEAGQHGAENGTDERQAANADSSPDFRDPAVSGESTSGGAR